MKRFLLSTRLSWSARKFRRRSSTRDPRRSVGGWSRYRLTRAAWYCFVLSPAVWLSSGPAASAQNQQTSAPESAAYLLVIDHSGSMERKMPSGQSRWEEMQSKALDFISKLPLESRVWIAVFSGTKPEPELPPFETDPDRKRLISDLMRKYGKPEGGTALYDTLGLAFEEAERLSQQNPGRNISVLAYTDGKDEGSKEWTPAKLEQRFKQLVRGNQNLWLFYTRIGEEGLPIKEIVQHEHASEGTFKNPLPVSLAPSAVTLKNAVFDPKQKIELEFGGSDANWQLLQGTSLEFDFVPDPDQKIQVKLAGLPFRKGRVGVELEVANPEALQADQEYSGEMRIRYPNLQHYEVKAGNVVKVTFQKGQSVQIYERRPADNAIFAAGQPVFFLVRTLQDAKVLWDFGDDESATGLEVRHVYRVAGKRRVRVSAELEQRIGAKQEFDIEVIDVGVSVDPIPPVVVEGAEYRFACTGRGPIERYEWIIDGRKYEGRAAEDPAKKGSEISYTFARPGAHVLSVVAHSEKAVVQAEEMRLEVIERPAVEIVHPQAGQIVGFQQEETFRAQVRGPINGVRWIIATRDAGATEPKDILREVERPVQQVAEGRISELHFEFPEAPNDMDVVVEAVGQLREGIKMAAPTQRVALRVEYAMPMPRIELGGLSPFPFRKPIQFRLHCPQPFKSVSWDFGDGEADDSNNPSPLHRYKMYGPFQVTARVLGKGGRVGRAQETVNVIFDTPEARPDYRSRRRQQRRVFVGDTIQLIDDSSGDIVKRTWYLNGKLLAPEQVSLRMNEPGEHRLRLHVEGPPGKEGPAVSDEKETVCPVLRDFRFLFWAALVALVAAYLACMRLLLGNAPRSWGIYYSNAQSPNEDTDPCVRVGEGWHCWGKFAEFPMRRFFVENEYWGAGAGQRETIRVDAYKNARRWDGSLTYSGEGSDSVVAGQVKEDGTRKDYQWRDNRCKDDLYRTVYFRLLKKTDLSIWPGITLAVIALAMGGFTWWVYEIVGGI